MSQRPGTSTPNGLPRQYGEHNVNIADSSNLSENPDTNTSVDDMSDSDLIAMIARHYVPETHDT